MQVMKFGGASVKDAAAVRNVSYILRDRVKPMADSHPVVVVVSAMDKTTNALEVLADLATTGKAAETKAQWDKIAGFHLRMVDELFLAYAEPVRQALRPYLDELARVVEGILLLGEFPPTIYDRIMAQGELMSSVIVHAALQQAGLDAVWLDARQVVTTDASHQQADVVWSQTLANVDATLRPLLYQHAIVLTQGYIASTPDGKTTTLGREGSDYTASIFAHALDAERVTIWKDVPGVMSADPRQDPDHARLIHGLSYESAVEMTWYGATVIHPKTIKPLQNKGIPLHVRSFVDPAQPGTIITSTTDHAVPARIHKPKQALLSLRPRDFSFMDARHVPLLLSLAGQAGLVVSLVQASAIKLTLCVDDVPERLEAFASAIADNYELDTIDGLRLTSLLFTQQLPADLAADFSADGVLLFQRGQQHLHLVRKG